MLPEVKESLCQIVENGKLVLIDTSTLYYHPSIIDYLKSYSRTVEQDALVLQEELDYLSCYYNIIRQHENIFTISCIIREAKDKNHYFESFHYTFFNYHPANQILFNSIKHNRDLFNSLVKKNDELIDLLGTRILGLNGETYSSIVRCLTLIAEGLGFEDEISTKGKHLISAAFYQAMIQDTDIIILGEDRKMSHLINEAFQVFISNSVNENEQTELPTCLERLLQHSISQCGRDETRFFKKIEDTRDITYPSLKIFNPYAFRLRAELELIKSIQATLI